MDIAIAWSQQYATGDWLLTGSGVADLATDATLTPSIMVSLFSDAVATPDYKPIDGDPRGWWADTYSTNGPLGSNLWQLDRAKISNPPALAQQAVQYAQNALGWGVTGGYFAAPQIAPAFQSATWLNLSITIVQPQSPAPTQLSFSWPT